MIENVLTTAGDYDEDYIMKPKMGEFRERVRKQS